MRLRRKLHRLIRHSLRLLVPLLLLVPGGCVTTVVGAAVDVATVPVRVVGAGVNAVAPGQKERDRRRGKRARKAEEAERKAAKKAAKANGRAERKSPDAR